MSSNVTLELKEDFNILEEGTLYQLPEYRVVPEKGIERTGTFTVVKFVRGSKDEEEEIPARTGTLHEHLLSMMIHDLKHKNNLVPSREGSLVITKLEEARNWLRQRQVDRKKRDVEGTYNE